MDENELVILFVYQLFKSLFEKGNSIYESLDGLT